jgi:hypothetical protein
MHRDAFNRPNGDRITMISWSGPENYLVTLTTITKGITDEGEPEEHHDTKIKFTEDKTVADRQYAEWCNE